MTTHTPISSYDFSKPQIRCALYPTGTDRRSRLYNRTLHTIQEGVVSYPTRWEPTPRASEFVSRNIGTKSSAKIARAILPDDSISSAQSDGSSDSIRSSPKLPQSPPRAVLKDRMLNTNPPASSSGTSTTRPQATQTSTPRATTQPSTAPTTGTTTSMPQGQAPGAHLTVPGAPVPAIHPHTVYSGPLDTDVHQQVHKAHRRACPLCRSCFRCYGQYLSHCQQSYHTKKFEHHDCELSHSSLEHWKEAHHVAHCVCSSCTGGQGEPDRWGVHSTGCVCEKCDAQARKLAHSSPTSSKADKKFRDLGRKFKQSQTEKDPPVPPSGPFQKVKSSFPWRLTRSRSSNDSKKNRKKSEKAGEIKATMVPDPRRNPGSVRSIRSIRSQSDIRSEAAHSTRTHRSARSRGYGPGGFGIGGGGGR